MTLNLSQTSSLIAVVLLAQPLVQPLVQPLAQPAAATSTTKKKCGRLKGSRNKLRKKRCNEQYEEIEQQQEVVEASAKSYNTRRARRNIYARLDDPFSREGNEETAGERIPLLGRRKSPRLHSSNMKAFFILLKAFIGTGIVFLSKAFKMAVFCFPLSCLSLSP